MHKTASAKILWTTESTLSTYTKRFSVQKTYRALGATEISTVSYNRTNMGLESANGPLFKTLIQLATRESGSLLNNCSLRSCQQLVVRRMRFFAK